jgi:hypothetical protein
MQEGKPVTRFRKGTKAVVKGILFCDACGCVCDDKCRSDRVRGEAVARAGMRLV